MKHSITPGEIVVSEDGVLLVVDHDDVKIFEIDLVSKYPGELVTWGNGVMICAGDRTLDVDTSTQEPTCFTLDFGDDGWDWVIVAEGARYTVRVVAYRVER